MKNQKIKKAYLQTFKGEFATEATFVAFMGCEDLQIPYEKFDYNDIGKLDIQKDTIIFGGITAIRHALTILNIVPPSPIDIPEELYPYTKRNIEIGTIKHFVEKDNFPLFVKPTKPKLFTGMVVSSKEEMDYLSALDLDANESVVITSSVVKFLAEYRVFVINKKICDCRKYSGNFSITPDFDFIQKTIDNYSSQPIAYAIDFGVTDTKETMLVEVNDGYSIGTYGLNHIDYANLCISRWNQIVGNN